MSQSKTKIGTKMSAQHHNACFSYFYDNIFALWPLHPFCSGLLSLSFIISVLFPLLCNNIKCTKRYKNRSDTQNPELIFAHTHAHMREEKNTFITLPRHYANREETEFANAYVYLCLWADHHPQWPSLMHTVYWINQWCQWIFINQIPSVE